MQEYIPSAEPLNFDKVWIALMETRNLLDNKFQETDRKQQVTDKQISELGKQIGGLNNKFGSYNEGLFFPSLEKILENSFSCTNLARRYKFKDNGNSFEVDLLGVADEACYLVEIKSSLREEAIEQLDKTISKFKEFDKHYRNEKLYGLICATDYDDEMMKKVLNSGYYFISAGYDIAKLIITDDFIPKVV